MRQSANPRSDRPAEAAAQALHLAFAPLDKSAFGAAVGAVAAIFFGSITLVSVQIPPAERPPLEALVVFFPGYEVSGGGRFLEECGWGSPALSQGGSSRSVVTWRWRDRCS